MLEFLQVLAGWLCADLFTGLVHLFLDNARSLAHWPLVGSAHRYFMNHHERPDEFLNESSGRLLRQTLLPSLILAPLALWLPWLVVPLMLGLLLCTHAHAWAHGRPRSWPVRVLQACRLLLHPRDHQRHHTDHRRAFGILNGWSNPLIDGVLWLLGR